MVRRNLGMTIDPVSLSKSSAFDVTDLHRDQAQLLEEQHTTTTTAFTTSSSSTISSDSVKSSIQKFVSLRKTLRMTERAKEDTDRSISRVKREMFRVRHFRYDG